MADMSAISLRNTIQCAKIASVASCGMVQSRTGHKSGRGDVLYSLPGNVVRSKQYKSGGIESLFLPRWSYKNGRNYDLALKDRLPGEWMGQGCRCFHFRQDDAWLLKLQDLSRSPWALALHQDLLNEIWSHASVDNFLSASGGRLSRHGL